jgi:mRNA-degrading endonuclease HigB of HigAB toxin-antitoxin module
MGFEARSFKFGCCGVLGSADQITVPNGRQVVVFNIGGGAFRLITTIHYNRGVVGFDLFQKRIVMRI